MVNNIINGIIDLAREPAVIALVVLNLITLLANWKTYNKIGLPGFYVLIPFFNSILLVWHIFSAWFALFLALLYSGAIGAVVYTYIGCPYDLLPVSMVLTGMIYLVNAIAWYKIVCGFVKGWLYKILVVIPFASYVIKWDLGFRKTNVYVPGVKTLTKLGVPKESLFMMLGGYGQEAYSPRIPEGYTVDNTIPMYNEYSQGYVRVDNSMDMPAAEPVGEFMQTSEGMYTNDAMPKHVDVNRNGAMTTQTHRNMGEHMVEPGGMLFDDHLNVDAQEMQAPVQSNEDWFQQESVYPEEQAQNEPRQVHNASYFEEEDSVFVPYPTQESGMLKDMTQSAGERPRLYDAGMGNMNNDEVSERTPGPVIPGDNTNHRQRGPHLDTGNQRSSSKDSKYMEQDKGIQEVGNNRADVESQGSGIQVAEDDYEQYLLYKNKRKELESELERLEELRQKREAEERELRRKAEQAERVRLEAEEHQRVRAEGQRAAEGNWFSGWKSEEPKNDLFKGLQNDVMSEPNEAIDEMGADDLYIPSFSDLLKQNEKIRNSNNSFLRDLLDI